MKKFTHKATIVGCDKRTPDTFKCDILVRETKNYWISLHGTKYRKKCGHVTGDWPMYRIVSGSIVPLDKPVMR